MGGSIGGFIEDATGINMGGHSRADQAVRAQQDAANQANATQLQMFNQIRDDMSPYREAGGALLRDLASGDFMNNWQTDPGYQFRMEQGRKALEGSAAARGNLNSGATLKALTRYGQDYGSQEYGNIYNREYNRLSNLVNLGQNAAAQTGQAGQNYANQFGQNTMGAANAQAAAAMGQGQQTNQWLQTGAAGASLLFSDRRLKKNLKPVSKEDLKELVSVIKPYHFEYLSKDFGEGEWIGVMAQDLEKSKLGKTVVFEDEKGRKKVHLQKLLSLLVTTFSEEAA